MIKEWYVIKRADNQLSTKPMYLELENVKNMVGFTSEIEDATHFNSFIDAFDFIHNSRYDREIFVSEFIDAKVVKVTLTFDTVDSLCYNDEYVIKCLLPMHDDIYMVKREGSIEDYIIKSFDYGYFDINHVIIFDSMDDAYHYLDEKLLNKEHFQVVKLSDVISELASDGR